MKKCLYDCLTFTTETETFNQRSLSYHSITIKVHTLHKNYVFQANKINISKVVSLFALEIGIKQ